VIVAQRATVGPQESQQKEKSTRGVSLRALTLSTSSLRYKWGFVVGRWGKGADCSWSCCRGELDSCISAHQIEPARVIVSEINYRGAPSGFFGPTLGSQLDSYVILRSLVLGASYGLLVGSLECY
jgi:hypothetical protein